VRVRRGVYASARFAAKAGEDPGLGQALLVSAAVGAQSLRDAVASHQTAALIHGISLLKTPPSDIVWLTRPQGRYRGGAVKGVMFHSAALPQGHVTVRYGVRLTTGARTVLDLARSLPYIDGVAAADSALHVRATAKAELRKVLLDCANWPGIDAARRVVEFSDQLSESVLTSTRQYSGKAKKSDGCDEAPGPAAVPHCHCPKCRAMPGGRREQQWPGFATRREIRGLGAST
jgi:hypothetical protein